MIFFLACRDFYWDQRACVAKMHKIRVLATAMTVFVVENSTTAAAVADDLQLKTVGSIYA